MENKSSFPRLWGDRGVLVDRRVDGRPNHVGFMLREYAGGILLERKSLHSRVREGWSVTGLSFGGLCGKKDTKGWNLQKVFNFKHRLTTE
jgi:hypothetical protein